MMMFASEDDFTVEKIRNQLLQNLLKENFYAWLIQKAVEGPKVLDGGGKVFCSCSSLGMDYSIHNSCGC